MRYLDTGDRDPTLALYAWLAPLMQRATSFACQTGYFSGDGLYPFEADLARILAAGGEVHLVVGANEDSIRSADVEYALELTEPYPAQASVVLVEAEDVLMHAKTYYLELDDGTRTAAVGSANLTEPGLAANIEAVLVVESDDDAQVVDDIADAIAAWRNGGRRNAMRVTRADIPGLIRDGVLDRPRAVRPRIRSDLPAGTRRRVRRFPRLGRLVRVRRRPRVTAARRVAPAPVPAPPRAAPPGGGLPLPAGVAGVVKKLSRQDTKGFRGAGGTAYIALPMALAPHLTMTPFGSRNEPRAEFAVEARLDQDLTQVVGSGAAAPNVTLVGGGRRGSSHRDLRFNVTTTVGQGIEYIAGQLGVAVPRAGDVVAVELLPGERLRVTFATGPEKRRLAMLCTNRRGNWGWLPAGVAPAW